MTSRKVDWSKRTAKKTAGTTVTLDDNVVVGSSAEAVWLRLEDVPLVASCLPGLDPSSLVEEGNGAFRARMRNTVMGISANWDLRATLRTDAVQRGLHVVLEGEDTTLNMVLRGSAELMIRPQGPTETVLEYTANLRVDGSLAAMGGPVIRAILADAIAQFVSVVGGRSEPERAAWHVRVRRILGTWWRRLTRRRVDNVVRSSAS